MDFVAILDFQLTQCCAIFQFVVPTALILTVEAYKLFSEMSNVQSIIETFLRKAKDAELTELRKASESCVEAFSSETLPLLLSQKVGGLEFHIVFFRSIRNRFFPFLFGTQSGEIVKQSSQKACRDACGNFRQRMAAEEIRREIIRCRRGLRGNVRRRPNDDIFRNEGDSGDVSGDRQVLGVTVLFDWYGAAQRSISSPTYRVNVWKFFGNWLRIFQP